MQFLPEPPGRRVAPPVRLRFLWQSETADGRRRNAHHDQRVARCCSQQTATTRAPTGQLERDGVIPGAHLVTRNVLEWRLDPASGHSDASLGEGLDRLVILLCDRGYQSSLAAATLQDLGFSRATDLSGGFQAWRAAGLPIKPYGPP
jgi:rhodanese-related sulfurtransferase